MSKRLAKRVLLVGWDAADWMMIRPLVDAGRMPTFARLMAMGSCGNLATIQPVLSPMLWNSIATGKRPDKHGICSFVEPTPDGNGIRPVTSTSRRCKALWNILTEAGLRSNVVSWFASHPAEPIRGAIVSDRFAAFSGKASENNRYSEGTFHPLELEEDLAPLAVSPWEIEVDALLPFVPRAGEVDQNRDDRLAKLAAILARTSTVHAAACRLAARDDWDFMAVYYSGIDEFGHHFMPYHPPRLPTVSEQDAAIYSEVMTGCYRFHDMMLEALLAYAGAETTVLLVSDHGFHSGTGRPSANGWQNPETWHREFGVACVTGPGIRRGNALYGATVLDVAPTVLALLGLSIGNDMDGRPWLEIFDEPVSMERIESWETTAGDAGMHSPELHEDPAAAAQVIRRLVDLGYIEPPSEDAERNASLALRDAKINLALAVTSSRRAADALTLWQELATEHPEEQGFQLQLASCLLRLGRWGDLLEAIESLHGELKQSPFVRLMLADIAAAEGRSADALAVGREIMSLALTEPRLANRLGQLFLKLGSFTEAATVFKMSLELQSDNPVALDGLAQVAVARRQFDAAVEHALMAVGLMHFFPAAHFHLAEALTGVGRQAEAITAYETALVMGYELATTHARLAALYRLRNPAKAKRHEYLSLVQ
jgi:predicted AlkP superfamily phosphohydrolase/phosphomutase/tetratricopeptide (TPR) repeat protein